MCNSNSEVSIVEDDEENTTEDIEENEYITKDSVKKFQFEYNKSTCFSDDYPEINFREDNSGNVSIAPGEGKTPTNILEEKDWDLKTFPTLHPDGMNSLHSPREVIRSRLFCSKIDEQR